LHNQAPDLLLERDYAKQPLTAEEIEMIFGNDDILPFLNTRHAVYKERGFAEKLPARDELIKLIISEPNLLRRPIVRQDDQIIIGFNQEKLSKFVAAKI
jgi:arsenate reductase-like glutaredoxin family protein